MNWAIASLVALAVLNPVVVSEVRHRARRRGKPRRDFCEVCGCKPRRIYEVSTTFDDGNALGIENATAMSATYCRDHAPDEARRKPNPAT